MTLFLDGPAQRPLRRAEEIGSAPPVATTAAARQAPEPSGLTGIPVAPKKPAPTADRKQRNTRMAAIRAAALRVAARQEQEVEEVGAVATAATTTATATPEEIEEAPVEQTSTATTTAAPATRGPGPYCAATWEGTDVPCRGRARRGSDFCSTHQPEETEMSEPNNYAMLAAMEAEPERQWTREELHRLRGGPTTDATYQTLKKLAERGVVDRPGRGLYQWAGAKEETPKSKKKAAPAKKSTPKPGRPEPEEETAAETDPIDDRLRWLIDGVVRGFISRGDCVAQVKALVR